MKNIQKNIALLALLGPALFLLTACEPPQGETHSLGSPVVTKVTAQNYLNGEQFCKQYESITSREYARSVHVPKDYSNPNSESIRIYTWTTKAFDASKPTVIVVNGGPGQNSHDTKAEGNFGLSNYNEINFDQRGLGCSAPNSYKEYKNPNLYSTANTVKDMEQIRKAYGISSWSVYGISYGTIPATQYASKYSGATRSLVLEGVVGTTDKLHRWNYKAEKANLMIQDFNGDQKRLLADFMSEGSEDSKLILQLLFGTLFMQDGGLSTGRTIMNNLFQGGSINRTLIARLRQLLTESSGANYAYPQYPGSVDENILTTIYCKELDYKAKDRLTLNYSSYLGFYETSSSGNSNAEECAEAGVTADMEQIYRASDYPVISPVYYFQGSHDGATMAAGARIHWMSVPKSSSFFLLAQKGGHNPGLTRLYVDEEKKDSRLRMAQQNLFRKSFDGLMISNNDLEPANRLSASGRKWILFTDPSQSGFESELAGIKKAGSSPRPNSP